MRHKEFLRKFQSQSIAVVGDIMLDKYIWGNVTRISPEAPVQVVSVQAESYAPGGAANVANNIAAIGSCSYMSGIVGKDAANEILLREIKKRNIKTEGIIIDEKKPTIQKVRIIGQNQQLLRVDYEKDGKVSSQTENKLMENIRKVIADIDGIIFSDYGKGVVTESLINETTALAKKYNWEKVQVADDQDVTAARLWEVVEKYV